MALKDKTILGSQFHSLDRISFVQSAKNSRSMKAIKTRINAI